MNIREPTFSDLEIESTGALEQMLGSEKPALAVYGYFAVVQRLWIDGPPKGPAEGAVGTLDVPTLMADAPLVGLITSKLGFSVSAALSHPGSNTTGEAAARFLRANLAECTLGPASKPSFHLQVLSKNANPLWFSDPSSGLASLREVRMSVGNPAWTYVDNYPWLDEFFAGDVHMAAKKGLYVNVGTADGARLNEYTKKWRRIARGRALVVQASIGRLKLSPDEIEGLSAKAVYHGADLAIVTAGVQGIAISSAKTSVFEASLPFGATAARVDTVGAGAAVSASVIGSLLVDIISPQALAKVAVQAGMRQCSLPGALNEGLYLDWEIELNKSREANGNRSHEWY